MALFGSEYMVSKYVRFWRRFRVGLKLTEKELAEFFNLFCFVSPAPPHPLSWMFPMPLENLISFIFLIRSLRGLLFFWHSGTLVN